MSVCVCVSCCWACWLCSPRWKGCTPQLSFLCFTVCSSRPCRTAITLNDPSHPRGEKAWWIHTSNHLKFLTTLSTSHLKCQPNHPLVAFPPPELKGRQFPWKPPVEVFLFSPPSPELRALSCLYFLPRQYRERGVCVCVFMCVFKHSIESIFAVCACVYVGEVRACIKNGWNVSSSLTLNSSCVWI